MRGSDLLQQWVPANRRMSRDVAGFMHCQKELEAVLRSCRTMRGSARSSALRAHQGKRDRAAVLEFPPPITPLAFRVCGRHLAALSGTNKSRPYSASWACRSKMPIAIRISLSECHRTESIFRAAVSKGRLPICDLLLESGWALSAHPSRGRERKLVMRSGAVHWRRYLKGLSHE